MIVEAKLELAQSIIAARDAKDYRYIAWVDAVSAVTDDDDIRDLVAIMTSSSAADIFAAWAMAYLESYARHVEPRWKHQGKD